MPLLLTAWCAQVRLIEAKVFSPHDTMVVNSALDKLEISLAVYGACMSYSDMHNLVTWY